MEAADHNGQNAGLERQEHHRDSARRRRNSKEGDERGCQVSERATFKHERPGQVNCAFEQARGARQVTERRT